MTGVQTCALPIFLITLDHPCQSGKWALTTERYGFGTPEFVCGNVREMLRYIDKLGAELEKEVPGPLILEEKAVAEFISSQPDLQHAAFLHRISEHTYSVFTPIANQNNPEIPPHTSQNG